jgi:hypothetical protein
MPKGVYIRTEATLQKMRGRIISPEQRAKQSAFMKQAWADGRRKGHPMSEKKRAEMLAYHLGSKHTEEHRRKISVANKGLKRTPEQVAKFSGENHYNWKGGITAQNKLDRQRFRWELQGQVFNRDDYTCQICDERGGWLQVDHIKSWKECPELRFDIDNCRTLCMACHYYITFKRKIPKGVVWGHNLKRRITS